MVKYDHPLDVQKKLLEMDYKSGKISLFQYFNSKGRLDSCRGQISPGELLKPTNFKIEVNPLGIKTILDTILEKSPETKYANLISRVNNCLEIDYGFLKHRLLKEVSKGDYAKVLVTQKSRY